MDVLGTASRAGFAGLLFLLLLPSCANSKPQTRGGEEKVSSTASDRGTAEAKPGDPATPAPSCGHEKQVHGQGINDSGRDCLWDAYQAGREASLALTLYTVEGDPITYTLHVVSKTSIDVVEDNRDHWGSPGVRRSTCSSLERLAEENGHRGFKLLGCEGAVKRFELR